METQGQHVRRRERIEEYARWSGATPVGVKQATDGSVADVRLGQDLLEQIRMSLRSGVSRVHCDCQHAPTVAWIKEQLTADEQTKVRFGAD